MKRWVVLPFSLALIFLIGAQGKERGWETLYTPTRLEWLALQCNVLHPQKYNLIHSTFIAAPPDKIEVVVKLNEQARQVDKSLRQELAEEAKTYVRNCAKAHDWSDPLEIEVIEVFR